MGVGELNEWLKAENTYSTFNPREILAGRLEMGFNRYLAMEVGGFSSEKSYKSLSDFKPTVC